MHHVTSTASTNKGIFNYELISWVIGCYNIIAKDRDLSKIILPTDNQLVIEGAGGLLVPLNNEDTIADLIPLVQAEVVLVSNLYLGSINHTLLTIEELKRRGLPVKGIIFNGEANRASEDIILQKSGYRRLLDIPKLAKVDKETVRELAKELKENWE